MERKQLRSGDDQGTRHPSRVDALTVPVPADGCRQPDAPSEQGGGGGGTDASLASAVNAACQGNLRTAVDQPAGHAEAIVELPLAELRPHPLLQGMPRMRPQERDAFQEDVRRSGVQDPITVQRGGTYVDGFERVQAALAAGYPSVQCRIVDLTPEQIEAYILRATGLRRNLTNDQQAVLAARLQQVQSKATNRERARKAGKAGGRGRGKKSDSSEVASSSELSPGGGGAEKERARSAVAKERGISEAKLKDAAWLLKKSPELAEAVQTGAMRLTQAKHKVTEEKNKGDGPARDGQRAPKAEPPKGRWRILPGNCLDVLKKLDQGSAG